MTAILYELLPGFAHTLLLRLTGWRIVRREARGSVRYLWTRRYPIT